MDAGGSADAGGALVINGWSLFAHQAFVGAFEDLLTQVETLTRDDPHAFHHHPTYKLFQKVCDCVFERVPTDPASKEFIGGGAFDGHTSWRRAKHGMPPRYRLFFQFRSHAPKTIIFAWFNSVDTLRKAGSRTDCYAVFVRMVEKGEVPDDFEALLKASGRLTNDDRTRGDEAAS